MAWPKGGNTRGNPAAEGWTDDRIAQLKKLYLEGKSGTQIAKALQGGITRNAVIGKIHRLGLSGHASASQPSPRAVRAPVVKKVSLVAGNKGGGSNASRMGMGLGPSSQALPPMPLPADPKIKQAPRLVPLVDIGAGCKWPIGDPVPVQLFCALRRHADGPYCEEHGLVARAKPSALSRGKTGNDLARQLRRYI